jgi:cell shape-determining protein MreC
MSIVVVHSLIVAISALLFFIRHVASCYPPHVAKFMHARPQEKVGEAPEATVAMEKLNEVEEPCLL